MNPDSSSPPQPCPYTVTVRRNPSRTARRPLLRPTTTSSSLNPPPSFPINDLLSIDLNPNPNIPDSIDDSRSLKVFLRVRPVNSSAKEAVKGLRGKGKCVWPRGKDVKEKLGRVVKGKEERSCVVVNGRDEVRVVPPEGAGRMKEEVYNGFSCVFDQDAAQDEVYEKMVCPIVEDFMNGKSGMLAALGPSGSGKTYTFFGSHRDPGMVPHAIRQVFSSTVGNSCERIFYLSLFEIYSEKGKVEKLLDLSPDGGDIHLQHSGLKGLKEVLITDAAQAESLIASGMARRATAATGSNSQSSRSQCIINIRSALNEISGGGTNQLDDPVLTFVDLAGAEREKKTGNQGKRLLEGNFINNTSMVFSLCLRSLLEHQKNPKQPMRKHFQSSLLTRYLRDYLEGKKRMALILTVRPGERDYLDTSFLLRQASPYMEIKFLNTEETINLPHKRHIQATSVVERPKRVKRVGMHGCKDDEEVVSRGAEDICTDEVLQHVKSTELNEVSAQSENSPTSGVIMEVLAGNNGGGAKMKRDYEIMKGFSKAIWKVLKEYKHKLKVLEQKVEILSQSLENERTQHEELQKECRGHKFMCCYCKNVEEHDAAYVADNISDSKEVASLPELTKLSTDILDHHMEVCQRWSSNPDENDSLPPSHLDEEELCLIDGDFCASMNEDTSSLEIDNTSPKASYHTDILDCHRELNGQQKDFLSEELDLSVKRKEEVCYNTDIDISTSIIKDFSSHRIGDSEDRSTTPHANGELFDHTYEQEKLVQPEIEDPSSPINVEQEKPCHIVAEFCASRMEFGSHPGIGKCNTSSETAASASNELCLQIEVYEHTVIGQFEERDPTFNQEEGDPCCRDGYSSAVAGGVASIPGIGPSYRSKAATHQSNDLFDLGLEDMQQGDMELKGRDHLSLSNHEEENPPCLEEMEDSVTGLFAQQVAVSNAPLDEVVSKGESKEDDTSCLINGVINGDISANLDKVVTWPATPDLCTALETSPPAASWLDAKEEIFLRRADLPSEEKDPPLNEEETASSPALPDLCTTSETSSPAEGFLDAQEEIYEQCINVLSKEKDPPLNQETEVLCHIGGVCASLSNAASTPGVAEGNACRTPSHVADDLFDLQEIEICEHSRDDYPRTEDPPSLSVEEVETHSLKDGDLLTSTGICNSDETEESTDNEETSYSSTDNFHPGEVDEKSIIIQTDIDSVPPLHQNEDDACDINGDHSAIRSKVASSPVIVRSCDMLVPQLENSEPQSNEQPKGRDHPSPDPLINISLQPVANSSAVPVNEAVSKGEGKEKAEFANPSNLTLPACEEHCIPRSQSLKEKKPRRRLMPASSVLLRDINTVDFKEDTDMGMLGGRGGGRKIVDDDSKRSKGSITLLRLLKNANR